MAVTTSNDFGLQFFISRLLACTDQLEDAKAGYENRCMTPHYQLDEFLRVS